MASNDDLMAALRRADAAGDTEGAQRIAGMIRQQGGQTLSQGPEAPSAAGAFLRSAGHELFGMGDIGRQVATYVHAHLNGHPVSWDDAGQAARDQLGEDAALHPEAVYNGKAAGLIGSLAGGGAIEKAGAAALPEVAAGLSKLPGLAQDAIRGAVYGGGTSAAQTGGNPVSTVTGTVLGAAGGTALGTLPQGTMAAGRKVFSDTEQKAWRALAKTLDENPDELIKAVETYHNTTGHAPALADVVNGKTQANFAPIPQEHQGAGAVMQDAAQSALERLPTRLGEHIDAAGPTGKVGALVDARQKLMDATVAPFREAPVVVTKDQLDLFQDPLVRDAVGSTKLGAKIAEAAKNAEGAGQAGNLTLDDFDKLRQALRSKRDALSNINNTGHNTAMAAEYGDLANQVEGIAAKSVPEYGQALDQYRADSRLIDGFQHGYAGKGSQETNDPRLLSSLASPEGQQGLIFGARSRLLDRGTASEASAANTLDQLRQGAAPTKELGALTPSETATLQAKATAEQTALRNRQSLAPNELQPKQAESRRAVQQGIESGAAVFGHALTGFKAHLTTRLITKLHISAGVAKKAAEMFTSEDPAVTAQAVSFLRKKGVSDAALRKWSAGFSRVGGVVGGSTASETTQ